MGDLLGKCPHALKSAVGGGEIVLILRHGFGGRDYFLFLAAEKLGIDLCRGWLGCGEANGGFSGRRHGLRRDRAGEMSRVVTVHIAKAASLFLTFDLP